MESAFLRPCCGSEGRLCGALPLSLPSEGWVPSCVHLQRPWSQPQSCPEEATLCATDPWPKAWAPHPRKWMGVQGRCRA